MRGWTKPVAGEGIWAIVLRTINAEPTLWDAILPECCLGLPPGLAEVDALLDDPRFFLPFVPFFAVRAGRPSIPIETYLRMMFLRFRYHLGYERLCAEVSDSIGGGGSVGSRSTRRCRIRRHCSRSRRAAGMQRSTR